jgi:HEAT repeat protein
MELSGTAQGIPAEDVATEGAQAEQLQTLHVVAQQGNLYALQQALRDPDSSIQATAFALFAEQDRQGAIAAVLSLSASEQSEQRWQALQLLHQSEAVDEETVLAALHAALADADATVKSYAIHALADRGGTEAFASLHQALRDPDPAIRRLVLESVIQLDDGLPLVQEGLADAEETIRALARSRLGPAGSAP